MSDLELRQFHSFLEGLIDASFRDGRFSVDRIVSTVIAEHPEKLQSIRLQLDCLGLRAHSSGTIAEQRTRQIILNPTCLGSMA